MRTPAPEHRGSNEKASRAARLIAAAILFSATGVGIGASPSAAQDGATEVAHVEAVKGRVVAAVQGGPILLDILDTIVDRTRLDLLPNSELQICHYRTNRVLTLRGPLRASVSADGVAAENAKAVHATAGTCAAPVASTFQGGIVSRGVGSSTIHAPVEPSGK